LYSVYFTDANTGFAVGESGKIIKTTNGGMNWDSQISGTSDRLSSIFFYESNTGWIVGNNGTILKTTDGGMNWESQVSGTSNHLYSVIFTDANIGFAVGTLGTILKTTNGGTNWESQVTGITPRLLSVYFLDDNTGWAVGDGSTIIKTTNGGVTFVDEKNDLEFPQSFVLYQNYPNPFNPSTTISWQSPVGSHQTLKIYDVLGNLVVTLVDEYRIAGSFEVDFDATDLTSGVYIYQIIVGNYIQTRKMILLK
ncbi:MAG: YCF48-related protein, partial [Ignavibacteria bacterium]|nr:YCF48-related protein [Ignavibacteria bacterium]